MLSVLFLHPLAATEQLTPMQGSWIRHQPPRQTSVTLDFGETRALPSKNLKEF